jgi:uncharacterized protein YutE (UPF0331/DUF86 family)
MVDGDRVADLIASGERYLADVVRFRDEVGRAAFLADRGEQYRIEFPLQQAIQRALDLAAHLSAATPGARPQTLARLFDRLADDGVIAPEHAARLGAMARFRNLLVHDYGEIDPERVWAILTSDLGDLHALFRAVGAWHLGGEPTSA